MRPGQSGPLMRVLDLAVLGRLVSKIRKREGSQVQAARKLGLSEGSQSYVSKLCRGQVGHLSARTYEAIRRALDSRDREILQRAVLTPRQEIAVRQYEEWIFDHFHLDEDQATQKADALRQDKRYAGYLEALDQAVARRWTNEGERRARVLLAEQRILRPLLQGQASGGVERTWEE